MKTVQTPELEKIVKHRKNSQLIGEFLEWLDREEVVLAEWSGSDCEVCGEDILMLMSMNKEHLLAKYFCIDLAKAEKERQALLKQIQENNKAGK